MFTIPSIESNTKSINWYNGDYIRMDLPLFNPKHPNKVHYSDIVQGDIGSCWFLTVLISYIRPNTKNIVERCQDIIKSIVKFREDEGIRTIYRIFLNGKYIYVDDYVPISYKKSTISNSNLECIWFILFEKAMLSLMTYNSGHFKKDIMFDPSSNSIFVKNIQIKYGEMKAATIGISYLIGGKSKYYCLHKKDRNSSLSHINVTKIYTNFKNGNHILANTHKASYPGRKFPSKLPLSSLGAITCHCYAILDIQYSKEQSTYLITIQNPWGCKEIPESSDKTIYPEGIEKGKGTSIITWERFHYIFACVHMTE